MKKSVVSLGLIGGILLITNLIFAQDIPPANVDNSTIDQASNDTDVTSNSTDTQANTDAGSMPADTQENTDVTSNPTDTQVNTDAASNPSDTQVNSDAASAPSDTQQANTDNAVSNSSEANTY